MKQSETLATSNRENTLLEATLVFYWFIEMMIRQNAGTGVARNFSNLSPVTYTGVSYKIVS